MRKRRLHCFLLFMLSCTSIMQAQWDAPFSHYWAVKAFYNPAFAGETEQIRSAVLYRHQWAGIENAPKRGVLTADMPVEFLRRRHGTGIVVSFEQMRSLRNDLLGGQYSYRREIGKGALQIGIQAGIRRLKFDAGSLTYTPGAGPYQRGMLQVNPVDRQLPDLNAGIAWSSPHAFAGLSVLHLTQPGFYAYNDSLPAIDLQTDSARSSIPRSYHFMAGYNISLFAPLIIQPMVWMQSSLSGTEAHATLRMEYGHKFSGGFTWSPGEGYVVFGSTTFQDLEMGYAYNKHTTGPGSESKGSHELYLRYDLPLDYFRPKVQPQKSIRLL